MSENYGNRSRTQRYSPSIIYYWLTHKTQKDECSSNLKHSEWKMCLVTAANQVAHVNCGNCRMLLMYQYGARSVKCAVCSFVTSVGVSIHHFLFSIISYFCHENFIWIYIIQLSLLLLLYRKPEFHLMPARPEESYYCLSFFRQHLVQTRSPATETHARL